MKQVLPSDFVRGAQFSNREFLSSVIHELKNPLGAIIGLSNLLKYEWEEKERSQDGREYIDDLIEVATDLNELIYDLLDVNHCNYNSFSVDLTKKIDVGDVIRRSVKINRDHAIARRIEIVTNVDSNIPRVFLDPKRMKQIIVNLVSNSIKYSAENTKIVISARIQSSQLEISVKDQGYGMNEEEVATVFEKFQTASNANSEFVDSFGLGLAIVKELVEKQKGRINIHSKVNDGTEMTLLFPII